MDSNSTFSVMAFARLQKSLQDMGGGVGAVFEVKIDMANAFRCKFALVVRFCIESNDAGDAETSEQIGAFSG